MVEEKVYQVPDFWSKIDLYVKVEDDAGKAMPGIGYTVFFGDEKKEGVTGEDGMICEPGIPAGDIRIQLEDGRLFIIEGQDGEWEDEEAPSTEYETGPGEEADPEEDVTDYGEFDGLYEDENIEGQEDEAEASEEEIDELLDELEESEGSGAD